MPDNVARRLFNRFAEKLRYGSLTIIDEKGSLTFGEKSDLEAVITINKSSVYADLMLGGSLGAGEAYIRGEWESEDLTAFVRLFARNMELVNSLDSGLARIASPFLRALHWLNRNTRKGSRQNIEAHYDLGNDFFKTFLDKSMMYSAAIYPQQDSSLYEAQMNKLKVICEKLQLTKEDHLLEIGTGWGGLAIYAAEKYGCRVTTTTLSQEQHSFAVKNIRDKNLDGKIDVLLQDYRELQGTFDKVVSIEMVEAVGHEYLPEYFSCCSKLLKADGMFLMQVITIPDQRYERARRDIDFIKRYIFPGSCIPSIQRIMNCVSKNTDLRLLDQRDHTADYARTLGDWHANLITHLPQVREMTNDQFIQMWRFYFSYCEGAFAERAIGSAQMIFAKPGNRSVIK